MAGRGATLNVVNIQLQRSKIPAKLGMSFIYIPTKFPVMLPGWSRVLGSKALDGL